VPFRSVSMHAVSRDTAAFQQACIYAQVEVPPAAEDFGEDEGEGPEERMTDANADAETEGEGADAPFDGEGQTVEMRLVPADASTCARPPLARCRRCCFLLAACCLPLRLPPCRRRPRFGT